MGNPEFKHDVEKAEKIIDAFSLLKNAGIKRTSYNIIGLPNETEEMIIDTIKFNSTSTITSKEYSLKIGKRDFNFTTNQTVRRFGTTRFVGVNGGFGYGRVWTNS